MINDNLKIYKNSVFIFRRDLRIFDNIGLIKALKESEKVICCFIFNRNQIGIENEYRSLNSMQFLMNSLKELREKIEGVGGKLYFFNDDVCNVITILNKNVGIDCVYVNEDYTPFSINRDMKIKNMCIGEGIVFESCFDALLIHPENTIKNDKKPYTVFTPFYKKNLLNKIEFVQENNFINYYSSEIDNSFEEFPKEFDSCNNRQLFVNGGREEALKILDKKLKELNEYSKNRNYPILNSTTGLSAHIKFGTLSIRELYSIFCLEFGIDSDIVRQLFWREFYYSIAYFFPDVFGKEFRKEYRNIVWKFDNVKFEAWKTGNTGYPLIDAGIRELNQTGYMHNRVRMVVASFLVKDLHIDWRYGEKYFATKLVDYDPILNNGNWQWSASTGCDAQPYFRIFNPTSQLEKFDFECKYVKKWVNELENLKSNEIFNIVNQRPLFFDNNYPKPIVDHKLVSKEAIDMFKYQK